MVHPKTSPPMRVVLLSLLLVIATPAFETQAWTSVTKWTSLSSIHTSKIAFLGSAKQIQKRYDSISIATASPLVSSSSLLAAKSADDNDNNNNKSDGELFESLFNVTSSISSSSLSKDSSSSKDQTTDKFDNLLNQNPQLGIQIGQILEPLSAKEAADLKAAATEIINDAIAQGLDEIAAVREHMQKELAAERIRLQKQQEERTKVASDQLLNKIDSLTQAFLDSTKEARQSTKRAASADAEMSGKGLEFGVWGNLGGVTVTADSASPLLGSVQAAVAASTKQEDFTDKSAPISTTTTSTVQQEQQQQQQARIAMVADIKGDQYAKQLVEPLISKLKDILPGLQVDLYSPTATLPLGANNAQLVLLFLTSLSSTSAVKSALDRLLRKTLSTTSGSGVGTPPTQIVAISTVGTERTNVMPYSMQNLLGGGKLEQRRQLEEAVINTVRQRTTTPALDYTIIKLGEIKANSNKDFVLRPGDVLDGNTDVNTAVEIISQAMALQPAARNATLCCTGSLPTFGSFFQEALDDDFLRLDGPEVYRTTVVSSGALDNYDSLVEYLYEWAELLAQTGKGLTTPVRAQVSPKYTRHSSEISKQEGVQLLFLPTKTGANYISRTEEKSRETESRSGGNLKPTARKVTAKEGGLEILTEVYQGKVRVRVRRCNYAEGAVLKEITEDTIISRLKQGLEVWEKDHKKQ